MDLSFLKWPIIIAIVAGIVFLLSGGGVDYMFKKFTTDAPGVSAQKDEINEAGLSRLGAYSLFLWRYEKAMNIFQTAVTRFPNGKTMWYNKYRMVKCAEKMGDYKQAAETLKALVAANANTTDSRVPANAVLQLRAEKLIETHELEKR